MSREIPSRNALYQLTQFAGAHGKKFLQITARGGYVQIPISRDTSDPAAPTALEDLIKDLSAYAQGLP